MIVLICIAAAFATASLWFTMVGAVGMIGFDREWDSLVVIGVFCFYGFVAALTVLGVWQLVAWVSSGVTL